MHARERADATAAEQNGVISRPQAIRCGLTARQIEWRVASGRWRMVVPGIYRNAGAPQTWHQRVQAAVLAGPPGTVASCVTAAALHGLLPIGGTPHVIVPRSSSGRSRLALVHRIDLSSRDRLMVGGIPRTTIARTLLDCAGVVSFDALATSSTRRSARARATGTVVLESIERAQAGGGRKGVAALRRAVEAWTPGITPGSPAEMRLLRLIKEHGLPEPERQVVIRDADGRAVGRIDLGWRHQRVGFEYDSDRHHNPRHWTRDEARQAVYTAAGWEVHRVDKHHLRAGDDHLRRLLDGLRILTPAA